MTKFAFVFPGQGSQAIGMLNGFADNAVVQATIAEASDALQFDLGKLIAEGPKEDLDLTTNTQPVMLTAAVAFYRAWLAAGGKAPALVAGHSLGEYSALVAAGVIAFKDAVPLVRFRAQAMQEAVPVGQGGMAAILGLSDDDVRAACAEAAQGEVVEAVNFNAPAQVVIAGHKAAVDRACEAAKARGAKRALILPVSAPFHSSFAAISGGCGVFCATISAHQQCRCCHCVGACGDQGCLGASSGQCCALGRDSAKNVGARCYSCGRMWPGQGADRSGQAY